MSLLKSASALRQAEHAAAVVRLTSVTAGRCERSVYPARDDIMAIRPIERRFWTPGEA